MHEELIGQEASLSLPCTVKVTPLLLGFIEELMEVSGDEPADLEALESDLQGAVDALCAAFDEGAEWDVVAVFEIGADGLEVRLSCAQGPAGGPAPAEQTVTARQA